MSGACVAVGFITLPVQVAHSHELSERHKKSAPLGFSCSDQVILSEQFSKNAGTQGSAGAIFGVLTLGAYPGILVQENRKSVIGLPCRLEKSINATARLIRSLQSELEQLNQIIIQHRFVLDYIMGRNEYCKIIGSQCHLTFYSLNKSIEGELAKMQEMIDDNVNQSPNPLSWLWDWLPNLTWVRQLIVTLLAVVFLLIISCCCIQCIPNLWNMFGNLCQSSNHRASAARRQLYAMQYDSLPQNDPTIFL
ncbi:hypothetical protein JRQ81_000014 [Phrynocephalus forsythii]|uniref:Envelope glycoprotein n=1 Tax=Phrynocephalus forsythii TaxID=171643 RepID=A0A9Q1APP8_9SAUR|nr:hypothetical protein JRQ81_000014 [Phrynocephalus forsythii]